MDGRSLESYRLCEASELPHLHEQKILPAAELLMNERFVDFPARSEFCIPLDSSHIPRGTLSVPRVSVFRAETVLLNGFRLLKQGEQFFNDLSIVSYATARINAQFNAGLANAPDYESVSRSFLRGGIEDVEQIAGKGGVLVLASDEPSNFGSWLFRILPKYLLACRLGWSGSVFVYQQSWMTDLLRFAGGGQHELLHHDPRRTYSIRDAFIPSLPVPEVMFRPEILGLYDMLQARQHPDIHLGEKLYISRRQQAMTRPTHRALENETGLVAALEAIGFQEFIPENYPFDQQIAIFDRARIIIGCGGSNMFGCLFARHAELIIDLESTVEWIHAHRNLLSSTNANFSVILGQRTGRGKLPHQNWQLDLSTFLQGLQRLGVG